MKVSIAYWAFPNRGSRKLAVEVIGNRLVIALVGQNLRQWSMTIGALTSRLINRWSEDLDRIEDELSAACATQ